MDNGDSSRRGQTDSLIKVTDKQQQSDDNGHNSNPFLPENVSLLDKEDAGSGHHIDNDLVMGSGLIGGQEQRETNVEQQQVSSQPLHEEVLSQFSQQLQSIARQQELIHLQSQQQQQEELEGPILQNSFDVLYNSINYGWKGFKMSQSLSLFVLF